MVADNDWGLYRFASNQGGLPLHVGFVSGGPCAPRRRLELRISKSRRVEEGNMGSKCISSRGSRANQFKTTVLCDGSGFLVIIGCIFYLHIFEGGKENDCI